MHVGGESYQNTAVESCCRCLGIHCVPFTAHTEEDFTSLAIYRKSLYQGKQSVPKRKQREKEKGSSNGTSRNTVHFNVPHA